MYVMHNNLAHVSCGICYLLYYLQQVQQTLRVYYFMRICETLVITLIISSDATSLYYYTQSNVKRTNKRGYIAMSLH